MTRFTTTDVSGRRILLVGATGVLGRTYAEALAAQGAVLALADLPSSDVMELAGKLDATGIELDLTDEPSVVDGVARAADALGGLDGLICNAAATGEHLMKDDGCFAPFEDYPLSVWQRVLDVNLTGSFLLAREGGRALLKSGGGSMILVSSIYGMVGPDHRIYEGQRFKSLPGYAASKAGIIGLTKWLATWWGAKDVRVNCVVPGGVFNEHDTSFTDAYGARTPMGRMADRQDLVGVILFLLSDGSAYCTGQNFVVDGGYTAW